MGNEPSTDELHDELRIYGRWLEARSHVGLSAPTRNDPGDLAPVDEPADGPPLALADRFDRPAPGRSRVLAWAGGAVVTIGAAVIGLSMIGQPAPDLVAADPEPSTDVGPAVAATSGEGGVVVRVDGADDRAEDGSTTGAETAPPGPATPPAAGSTSEPPGHDQAVPSTVDGGRPEAPGTEDPAVGPDPAPSWPDGGSADPGSAETQPGAAPDPQQPATTQPGGVIRFLRPWPGEVVELNLANEFRATEVEGADRYRFSATQDGELVMEMSMTEPRFLLPSQLVGGPALEPGLLRLTVAALDGDRVLASSTVTVRLEAGGGRPPYRS